MINLDLAVLRELRTKLLNRLGPDMERVSRSASCGIVLSEKMRSTAGTANYSRYLIKLNSRLLTDHPHHIEQTFAHELAHLVAVELYGIADGRGHGHRWASIMDRFGYASDRCHNLDVTKYKRTTKRHPAKCGCQSHTLTTRQLNRALKGTSVYRCVKCKTQLIVEL